MKKNNNKEIFIIENNFYNDIKYVEINSNYNLFLKNICIMFGISYENINSISISYNDEDGDKVILTTEEDYMKFIDQVKEKLVNKLTIEINEKYKSDRNQNLENEFNFKQQLEQENKSLKNSFNIINSNNNIDNNIINFNNNFDRKNNIDDDIKNFNINFEESNNNNLNHLNLLNNNFDNINNMDNNIINNNHMNSDINNFNNNFYNNKRNNNIYNNDIIDKKINNIINNNIKDLHNYENLIPNNEDKIEDLLYNYKCSSCEIFPIIKKMFYCSKCNEYYCEECEKIEKIEKNHIHPLIIIETKNQLEQFEKEQNEKIKKRLKEINNNNNYNYNFNKNNNNRDNYNKKGYYDNYNDFPDNKRPPFEDDYYLRQENMRFPVKEIEAVTDHFLNRFFYYMKEYEQSHNHNME